MEVPGGDGLGLGLGEGEGLVEVPGLVEVDVDLPGLVEVDVELPGLGEVEVPVDLGGLVDVEGLGLEQSYPNISHLYTYNNINVTIKTIQEKTPHTNKIIPLLSESPDLEFVILKITI